MAKTAKPRKGRPPVSPEARRSKNFTFRSREALHHQLGAAAKIAGRSISEEIEFRLDWSFFGQRATIEALDLAYSKELVGILLVIAETMSAVGPHAGFIATHAPEDSRNWLNNPYAFAQATQAAHAILDALKPPGDPTPPHVEPIMTIGDPLPPGYDLKARYADLGRSFANTILEEAATGYTRTTGTVERARRLHRLLGPLAERLNSFTTPEFRDADSHIGDDQ
jgi:hypothetical protein